MNSKSKGFGTASVFLLPFQPSLERSCFSVLVMRLIQLVSGEFWYYFNGPSGNGERIPLGYDDLGTIPFVISHIQKEIEEKLSAMKTVQ